jgi:hypothetical protein
MKFISNGAFAGKNKYVYFITKIFEKKIIFKVE